MSGWTVFVSKFHDDLRLTMTPYQNRQLRTAEIAEIVRSIPHLAPNSDFIQPSDHCFNHSNDGACGCALTERAIFEQVRRGLYYVRNVA
jgi:hypothetical protein